MVSDRRMEDELSGENQMFMSARAAEYTISKDAGLKQSDLDLFLKIEEKI